MSSSKKRSPELDAVRISLFMECRLCIATIPLHFAQTMMPMELRLTTPRVDYYWEIREVDNSGLPAIRLQLVDRNAPNNHLFGATGLKWKIGILDAQGEPAFEKAIHDSGWVHWEAGQLRPHELTRFVLLDKKVYR